jgi:hypothetical protein
LVFSLERAVIAQFGRESTGIEKQASQMQVAIRFVQNFEIFPLRILSEI